MDVPDIALVVQWRATCNLSALWQRFGRAARNRELTGTALLFAEREHFDDEREAKAARKARRLETRKRKAKDASSPGPLCPIKQGLLETGPSTSSLAVPNVVADGSSDEGSDGEHDTVPLVNGVDPERSAAVLLEAMVEAIMKGSQSAGHTVLTGKHRKRVLDPALDLLINTGCRPGVGCCRAVFNACFDNSQAGERFHNVTHYLLRTQHFFRHRPPRLRYRNCSRV